MLRVLVATVMGGQSCLTIVLEKKYRSLVLSSKTLSEWHPCSAGFIEVVT
jgi:hypothetical protein